MPGTEIAGKNTVLKLKYLFDPEQNPDKLLKISKTHKGPKGNQKPTSLTKHLGN